MTNLADDGQKDSQEAFVARYMTEHSDYTVFSLYDALTRQYGCASAVRQIEMLIDAGRVNPDASLYYRFACDLHNSGLQHMALHYHEMTYNLENRYILQYAEYVLNNFRDEKGRSVIEQIKLILPRIQESNSEAKYYLYYFMGRLISQLAVSQAECFEATNCFRAALLIKPTCSACISGIQQTAIKQYKIETKRQVDVEKSVSDPHFTGLGVIGWRSEAVQSTAEPVKEARKRLWHVTEQVRYFPAGMPVDMDFGEIVDSIAGNAAPSRPLFSKSSKILTVGSCFARNFRKWLLQRDYPVVNITVPEQLNNSLAVRGFFDWSFTGNDQLAKAGYQVNQQREIYQFGDGIDSGVYRDVLKNIDGAIITFGLGEIWRDKITKDVFWHAIPEHVFDADRHEPIASGTDWNVANMKATIDLLREHVGDIPIIFTLSPVPLNATFRGKTVWEADCVSKSVLRTALDVVMSEKPPNVYYWPAFEMVRWVGAHLGYSTFSWRDDPDVSPGFTCDAQHPRQGVIKHITDAFHRYYYAPES